MDRYVHKFLHSIGGGGQHEWDKRSPMKRFSGAEVLGCVCGGGGGLGRGSSGCTGFRNVGSLGVSKG